MSTRARPDPAKRIEDLPDAITIGGKTFSNLRLLGPVEHQQQVAILQEVAGGCGCMLGGVFGVFALMGYLVTLYFFPNVFPQEMWHRVWIGLGIMILGASIGKLLGQLHAKRQFDHAAYALEQRILALQRAK